MGSTIEQPQRLYPCFERVVGRIGATANDDLVAVEVQVGDLFQETDSIGLSASATDPAGEADPLTYTWNITRNGISYAELAGKNVSFTAHDDGTYVASLRVSDGDGGLATKSASIIVQNVLPTVSLSGPSEGIEGSPLSFSVTASDVAGDKDPLSYNWSVERNGAAFTLPGDVGTTGMTFTFTPTDGAIYTVTVAVSDGEGSTSASQDVVVKSLNTPPVADGGGPYTVAEGGTVQLAGSGTDAEGDATIVSYQWDFDYNEATGFQIDASQANASFSAADLDGPASRTIALRIQDDKGAYSAVSTAALSITNVAPAPSIVSVSPTRQEGTAIAVVGSATDPAGPSDTLTYAWTVYKDGSGTADATGAGAEWSFTPDDSGSYRIVLTVRDDDGGANSIGQTISVANVAPSIALSAGTAVDEGSSFSLNLGDVTDPGADTVTGFVVNWGDGTSNTYTAAGTVSHVFADNLLAAITVDLVDEDGTHLAAGRVDVQVANVAPTVGAIAAPTEPTQIGTAVTASADFTDAGTGDTHTVAWENAGRSVGVGAAGRARACPASAASRSGSLHRSLEQNKRAAPFSGATSEGTESWDGSRRAAWMFWKAAGCSRPCRRPCWTKVLSRCSGAGRRFTPSRVSGCCNWMASRAIRMRRWRRRTGSSGGSMGC